ncbi:calcium-binding protein [Leisingera sp. NJS204]|uniref:calcium-binding protein n=1 Tax=Leisingera sp. NJS204 TaxID=2508307 RepID=UPI0010116021|nr:calcium-binding protein [Leisingera sp. NJS204]QAX32112.1 calcium-binding protein [Leisingera sp. NJS204]
MALAFTGRFAAEDLIFGADLRDLEIAVQDGQAVLYAATGMNGGISRWQLDGSGALPQLAGQQLHGQAGIRTGDFHLAEAGGGLRLLQGGTSQSALTFYELAEDGSLGSQDRDALAGADAGGFGAVAVLQLADGKSAFYAVGAASGGLQGWQLDAAGDVQGQAGAAGGHAAYGLDPAALLALVQTAGGPVLLAADARGLHSFRADAATGALSPGSDLGAEQGLAVSGVTVLEGFEAGGKSWALLGAAGSSSLTLMQVGADGGLQVSARLQDTAMTRFGGLSALEVVEAEGHVLVLAAGNDGGLSLFTLTPGGALIHLESLEHTPGLGLQNVTALEAAAVGGELQVFAASGAAGGISRFTLPLGSLGEMHLAAAGAARLDGSAGNDVLEGGRSGANLYGQAGDDVLVAGAEGGWLTGGSGADTFVINPAAGAVTVRDFTPGEDQLDLSLFEGLYSTGQLDAQARSSGMVMEAGGTRIVLISDAGTPLELADVFGPDLRFSFPQRQEAGETLPGGSFYGGSGADRLDGTGGDDLLSGEGGNDRLDGGRGNDSLEGGIGNDLLEGGSGNDRLEGGSGADSLKGGSGNDVLEGGSGNDRLYGGGGSDRLKGSSGNDLLKGGGSDDRLYGGSGADSLKGGGGQDLLSGQGGRDLLQGGGGSDTLSGGGGKDQLKGQGGHDDLKGGGGKDSLKGGAGRDTLDGGKGRDQLKGQGGDDRLEGGKGHDLLSGGGGEDVFVFARGHGRDTISDFRPGRDLIDLQGAAADGFADLDISRQDGGALILTGSGRIFLEDLNPGRLDADDFLF